MTKTYRRMLDDIEQVDFIEACDRIMWTDEWFPRISRIRDVALECQRGREDREAIAAAQRDAEPVAALDGETDYSDVSTADLPPGYDYARDPHWQRGMDLLMQYRNSHIVDDKGLAPMLDALDQRRQQFQGASKPREYACPTCRGGRYLRTEGWDGHPDDIGKPGSRFIMCPTCCPQGHYSELAERDAVRSRALGRAA